MIVVGRNESDTSLVIIVKRFQNERDILLVIVVGRNERYLTRDRSGKK